MGIDLNHRLGSLEVRVVCGAFCLGGGSWVREFVLLRFLWGFRAFFLKRFIGRFGCVWFRMCSGQWYCVKRVKAGRR